MTLVDLALTVPEWTQELRNPQRRQTTGKLRSGNTFCCLGVACDMDPSIMWELREDTLGGMQMFAVYMSHAETYTGLPLALREHLGVSEEVSGMLASLNDTKYTFVQIADVIDEMYRLRLVGASPHRHEAASLSFDGIIRAHYGASFTPQYALSLANQAVLYYPELIATL